MAALALRPGVSLAPVVDGAHVFHVVIKRVSGALYARSVRFRVDTTAPVRPRSTYPQATLFTAYGSHGTGVGGSQPNSKTRSQPSRGRSDHDPHPHTQGCTLVRQDGRPVLAIPASAGKLQGKLQPLRASFSPVSFRQAPPASSTYLA
jgi:hypothetical protein